MFNVIPFRAARNLMNTSMDDMLSDRFFRHFFDMSDMVGTAGFRVDVKEQPDAYVLEAELPGVKQDDITLTAENGVLTIAADINSEKKDNREGYLYSERRTGHVERRFSLEGVREDDITAKCEHGILTVTLPKMQAGFLKTGVLLPQEGKDGMPQAIAGIAGIRVAAVFPPEDAAVVQKLFQSTVIRAEQGTQQMPFRIFGPHAAQCRPAGTAQEAEQLVFGHIAPVMPQQDGCGAT